jgi:DNA invertase Pin-like site-specific DNA recombinase
MEHTFISYLRVSTKRQFESGLGLESQRQIVSNFIKHKKGRLLNEFVEQESGKVNDRIQLKNAIVTSQKTKATLVIAKLDRLSRSVSFISSLMESKVNFICCDMPEATPLTIHIFSALAEHERKMISTRTRDALQAKKLREPDWKPGTNNLTKEGRKKAYNTNYKNARNDINVRHALHYIRTLKENGHTYQYIAERLNEEGYRTRKGKLFHAGQVHVIWSRFNELGINPKKDQTTKQCRDVFQHC